MAKTDSAPFSYDGLDRVIHEKARLGLLTSLMAHPKGLAFADLKLLCGLTDGNLSRHLDVLHDRPWRKHGMGITTVSSRHTSYIDDPWSSTPEEEAKP